MIALLIAGCLVVGLCIGWSGIAGFLLPILFSNYIGLGVRESLFLSFSCFALSGILGAVGYYRNGELDLTKACILSVASLFGSFLGALLGGTINESCVKVILYVVVLLSGISIGVRELNAGKCRKVRRDLLSRPVLFLLGLVTSVICSVSGAGGPVLVMPLLVALGMDAKMAVGTALLDSVAIAIPAIVIYGSQSDIPSILPIVSIAIFSHGIGIVLGSRTARYISQKRLKQIVAIFSICFSLWMLLK